MVDGCVCYSVPEGVQRQLCVFMCAVHIYVDSNDMWCMYVMCMCVWHGNEL